VLRAPGETKTLQENIQDWLQLDEGDSGFQLLTEEEIAEVIFFFYFFFISTTYIIKFSIYLFYNLLVGIGRLVRKAGNLTVICEPIF
jgi:hypothetical protein